MAELVFTRTFLQELAEWEGRASTSDVAMLDAAIASIAHDPTLSGRFPSFYEPGQPSYLYRSDAVLLHYRLEPSGAVTFLNLFFPRS